MNARNKNMNYKTSIVSYFKTLAIYALYGLTHTESKNSIVKSKNRIVKSKNSIVQSKNRIVKAISYCFNNINNTLKNFKQT